MADEKPDSAVESPTLQLSLPAHALPYEAVLQELQTKLDSGLTSEQATLRLQRYGPNKLDEGEGVSVVKILVRQVANAMMLVKRSTFSSASPAYERPRSLIYHAGPDPGHGGQFWNPVLD